MERTRRLLLAAAVGITAMAGVINFLYEAEIGEARDAVNRGSSLAATTSGPIEYAETGAGIRLLSIHGAGGGFDQGLANVADLVGDGFRIIAPSRFGYLRTPVPEDSSPAAQADADARAAIERNVSKASWSLAFRRRTVRRCSRSGTPIGSPPHLDRPRPLRA